MKAFQLIVASALAITSPAMAGTVYSQPGTEACNPSCWTSHVGLDFGGFAAFDNFVLSQNTRVTTATWQGIYIPASFSESAPTPSTQTWYASFNADNAGFPGSSLYQEVVTPTVTLLGPGLFGSQPVNLYSFEATLPGGFLASANTPYWFSVISIADTFYPFFSWSPSTLSYDGITAQIDTFGGEYQRYWDRAFSLGAVPEPENWALLIAGFGLIGAMARRQRAVAA